MKKFITAMALLVLLGALSGCGYRLGSMMHPQIKTIAIGDVVNETTAYNVSVQLQQLLSEQFQLDGSLKVVTRPRADCIVYARILSVGYVEIASRAYIEDGVYQPQQWQTRVNVEFSVVIPGNKEPLIERTVVNGISNFQVQADLEVNRQRSIMMACRDAAQKIVQNTTEAW